MPRVVAAAAACLALVAAAPAWAQTATGGDSASALRHLLPLDHGRAPARYTPGALDRAARVQERFALLAESFARWANHPAAGLPVLVLAPEDWALADPQGPFGTIESTANGTLLVPGWGDDASIALWQSELGWTTLPWPGGSPVRGTEQESASLALADLVAMFEASELLLARAGLRGGTPEMAGVFAALVARAFFEKFEPNRVPEVRQVLAACHSRAAVSSVAFVAKTSCSSWAPFFEIADLAAGDKPEKALKATMRLAQTRERKLMPADFAARFPSARPAMASWKQ